MQQDQRPVNLNAEPIEVEHAKLERWDEDSIYKSKCPACPNGILLVCRIRPLFKLSRIDRCVSCGQAVIYTDAGIGQERFHDHTPPT